MTHRPPTLFDHVSASASYPSPPDVSGLPRDVVEQFGRPYLERYFAVGRGPRSPGGGARFHRILRSDVADMHDHPWDFVSVIIAGRYVETTPHGEQEFRAGSVLVRRAEDRHRLTLPDGPVWTFITVGPARRRWGFVTADGWVPWRRYLERTGL